MSETALKILLDLVKQFPLPLMLQTEQGEVIAQNQLWQQHCLALQPLPPQEARKMSRSREMSLERESYFSSLSSGSHLYQEMRVEIHNGAESVWNISYIPLGNLVKANPPPRRKTHTAHHNTLEPLTEVSPDKAASANILWLLLAQNCSHEEQLTHDLAARNADLVQLNRLKDEFLACITHELKTPLTAILGLSSLLKDHLLGTLNDRQSRYVHMIHHSGRQLMKVVNDILDLTRLETGQIELLREPVSIQHVCDRAISAALQLYNQMKTRDRPRETTDGSTSETGDTPVGELEKNIHLEIEPGLEWLVADEPRLRQMLVNLLSNALKFTEPEDKIGLRVNRWQNWVAFSVWDTGMGIPENKQSLIFQKFQQLEHPLTRQFEGLGLGLVITQLLARLHGGEVSFMSRAGEGSTFTILLPDQLWEEDIFGEEGALPYSSPQASLELPLLLIAHTQPSDLISVQTQTNLNFRVIEAHSGLEALEKTRRLKPSALLLNPLLPLLSGQDVLTILKSDPETANIPVILLGTEASLQPAMHLRIEKPLTLPLNPTELQHILNQLWQTPTPSQPSAKTLLTFIRIVDRDVLAAWSPSPSVSELITQALQTLMQSHRCQILEVDDLDQAELLARIWKPQLLLVETLAGLSSKEFLELVQQSKSLSHLSLISFQPELSALAAQTPDRPLYHYDTQPTLTDLEHVKQVVQLLRQVLSQSVHDRVSSGVESKTSVS